MTKYKNQQVIEEFRKRFPKVEATNRGQIPGSGSVWKMGIIGSYSIKEDIEQFLDEQLTKKEEEEKMKLFIWRDIRCDYTCGIGFAMARNIEEAREVIKSASEDWEWDIYKGELMDEPEIYEIPTGAWISGGG